MANFHTNFLVIAANEEDMQKILLRFAENLAANQNETGFDYGDVEGVDSIEDLYRVVGNAVDSWYMYAFAPDPVGRGMSETASVGLARYGQNMVLTVSYSTAWEPNSSDLDTFFEGLPGGDYGVALFDADEGNGYGTINTLYGFHHGLDAMEEADPCCVDYGISNEDLKSCKRELIQIRRSDVSDLAKLADIVATCEWPEWGWVSAFGEDDRDEVEKACYRDLHDDQEIIDSWCYGGVSESIPLNWESPNEEDLAEIGLAVLCGVCGYPKYLGFNEESSPEGNEEAEHLLVGDPVTLVSDWFVVDYDADPDEDPVAFHGCGADLKVYGPKGGLLGTTWCHMMYQDETSDGVLVCILPHLRATLQDMTPISLRNAGVGRPKLTVRLDLEPIDAGRLVDEVHALLKKDIGSLSLSTIKGGE